MRAELSLRAAVAHHERGEWRQAEPLYRRLLERNPENADAWHLLGVLCGQTGRVPEAIDFITRAVRLQPGIARYHCNLGKFLGDAARDVEAIEAYREALRLDPGYADAYSNLAATLNARREYDAALSACQHALVLRPSSAAAHNNLGVALRGGGLLDEALEAHRRAIELAHGLAEAHTNLGAVLKDLGRVTEAIAAYRKALAVRPAFEEAQHQLLNTLHYDPDLDATAICGETRDWYRRDAASLARASRPHVNDRSPTRRLRIGYVSPDFRDHPVGLNLLPLFRGHDRHEVEIYAYSGVVRPDAVTDLFRPLADAWRNTVGLSHARLAQLVRDDGIDILVDLTLHASGSRVYAFALKPAPVQVTFAGYPGTTGLETIDYRLTDPHLDPPGENEGLYSERTVRLPDSFWCIDPMAENVPVGPLPALGRGVVTFGCLNNFCKVNDPVLRMWASILSKLADSRLLLAAPAGSARAHVLDVLVSEGVGADRVTFTARKPRPEYLRLYDEIDVALDTVPYNGHTTSLDAYWMGVPVVTLVGRTVVGRAGLSQLANLGLRVLAADSPARFVDIAVALASDLEGLAGLRASLRERMRRSALMDGRRFAANVEAAYRAMWRDWCATATGTWFTR